ncbi:Nucleoside-diphosphate-sugar epimerase [Ectothiorhodospira magna]|uniref:Nucleoside-diphosphate-sugar epimerase n=1 Tax=Ectothiorhodospira magna TaxID=867345 RepID=A0A1H9EQ35_9GAMM|nr:SDR family oxidoreductase [Ectothiorhodospira magna]SEQ27759.1 Nucleoside-diphosphate-sugar epimerase [Ectothiorhodospira magna]
MAPPDSPRIAVTGAGGFVGSALCTALEREGRSVCRLVRRLRHPGDQVVGQIGPSTDWRLLEGMDVVIHAAARVHVMTETAADPTAAFAEVNVLGTRQLAIQAAAMGVRRLVFLSSVKVHGEKSPPGQPFAVGQMPAPQDAYGRSKWEAEQALWEVAAGTGLEVVVIRPPLVHGPGMKGNLARLMGWIRRGIPLPLASVDNRRSLVGLDNLVDLLSLCAVHPAAAGETFLVSDGVDLSTPDLVRHLAAALGRQPRLFPLPPRWLFRAGRWLGREPAVARLCGCLQVDAHPVRQRLGWQPPVSLPEGLRRAVGGAAGVL